jgi:hypothetical protein
MYPGGYPPAPQAGMTAQGPPPGGYAPQGPPPGAGQVPYASPGDASSLHGYPPAIDGQPVRGRGKGERRTTNTIIVAVILTVVVVAGSAAFYFLAMKKGVEGPEGTVRAYFSAICGSDPATVKSLYAPGAVPGDEIINNMTGAYARLSMKWSDLMLKAISQTASDASVQVIDATISASLAGHSKTQQLRDLLARDGTQMVFTLKLENGKWLVTNDAGMTNPNGPGAPASTGTRIDQASAFLDLAAL